MKRVLVTDACERSALAITRSLGKKGVPVYTADETPTALSGCSKHSRNYNIYPPPASRPEAFIRKIIEICKQHEIDVIMPVTEMTSSILLSSADQIPEISLPFAPLDIINMLSDKCSLIRIAESLNINVPDTRIMDHGHEARLSENLSLPMVLKPAKSWLLINGCWHHTSVRIADSLSEANEVIASDVAFTSAPYMLQEYIPGYGAGIFAIYNHGEPLAFFAHKRLREKPPRGGVSVLSESVPIDPAMETAARKLLNHAGWHGVAMVEFRISDEGVPYLMEVNTRFWGSLQLAVDSGVDFPWMLYRIAVGDKPEPVTSYRTGRRLRWLLGDLDTLYLVLRDPSFTIREKLRALKDFLLPAPFRTKHEVNRISDMGPFWHEARMYLRDLIK